jgi:hypothetical protein
LNCRECDISILRQALTADHGQRFLDRIAPIPSRSKPTLPFVLDDLIASSRGKTGHPWADGLKRFRWNEDLPISACLRDSLSCTPRRLHCRLSPVRREKRRLSPQRRKDRKANQKN